MNETQFWAIIESAWHVVGLMLETRQNLTLGTHSPENVEELLIALESVIPAIRKQLNLLSREDLLAFDRILERNLYALDRADIQEQTDGSDDGFLYARGLIVAMGKAYYDAVNTTPSLALMDMECEEICYLSQEVYKESFGTLPPSEISRESYSNRAGWTNLTE